MPFQIFFAKKESQKALNFLHDIHHQLTHTMRHDLIDYFSHHFSDNNRQSPYSLYEFSS